MTEKVIEAEAAPEACVKEKAEAVVKEAVVIEEVTEAEAAPESAVKE